MRKIKVFTAILLASSFLVTGCKNDPTPSGSVDKVSIIGSDREAIVGYTFTITANVVTTGDASKDVTWSTSNSEVGSISNTTGTEITVSALKYGSTTIRATSNFDNTKFDEFTLNVLDWSNEEIALMNNTIGQKIPYFKGNYTWSSEYYQSQSYIFASSFNEEAFDLAIETLEENGYRPVGDDEGHVYFDIPSVKESLDSVFFVELDFFTEDDASICLAYLTETIPEWPEARINKVLEGYTDGVPETIPAFEASSYSFQKDTEYLYSCSIIAYGGNLNSYLNDLANNLGWYVYDYGSYCAMYSPRNSIEIECGYVDQSAILFVITANDENMLDLLSEWPTEKIAEAEEGHSFVEVPKAKGTNFTFLSGINYFAQMNVYGGSVTEYNETLLSNGFEKTTIQGNYSSYRKQDLLIDIYEYKTHYSISIGEGPKAEWPIEKIAEIIDSKVKVSIPQAPGALFRLIQGDSFYELTIMVEGGLLSNYKTILQDNGFTISYDGEVGCDVAEKGKLFLDLYQDPDNILNYAICAYFGQLFPHEEVQKVVERLVPGTTTIVPEFYAESYRFMDYTIVGGWGYVEGFGYSETIIDDYKVILTNEGWTLITRLGKDMAISPDEKVSLTFYIEENIFYLEIQAYIKPDLEWPTDKIATAVSLMSAEGYVPEFTGENEGFIVFNPESEYPGQISILVDSGVESLLIQDYIEKLEDLDFIEACYDSAFDFEFTYYAEEGKTLALNIFSMEEGIITIELKCLGNPAKRPEWPTEELATFVTDVLKAEGTILEYDGKISKIFLLNEEEFEKFPTLFIKVGVGNETEALASYTKDLLANNYFAVDQYGDYKYYAQEGDTLRPYIYISAMYPGYLLIELVKGDPAVKPVKVWPTEEIATMVEHMGVTGSPVPEFAGEATKITVQESHDFGDSYLITALVDDSSIALNSYIQTLTNAGYFVAGDNYGDPIYAKEGETLGISPYTSGDDVLLIELIKLDAPASK